MEFPKYVYKLGTGRKVNDNGLYVADAELVASAEALAALGPGWCSNPVEAAAPEPKSEEKPSKKAK